MLDTRKDICDDHGESSKVMCPGCSICSIDDNLPRAGVPLPLSLGEIDILIGIVKEFNQAYEEDGFHSSRQELLTRSEMFIAGILL
jgi:hypothetical protein